MQPNRLKQHSAGYVPNLWQAMTLTLLLMSVSIMLSGAQSVPGHVLVRIEPTEDVATIEMQFGTSDDARFESRKVYSLITPMNTTDADFAQQLSVTPGIIYSAPDDCLNLPDVVGTQFHLAFDAGPKPGKYVNQRAYQQVNLDHARKKISGRGVTVAVLDTGASFDHPVLAKRYLHGYNTLNSSSLPVDAADGLTHRAAGHGTMIAGILAKIAPGAQILPVRVLDGDGNGTVLNVLKGLDYAISHGAKVISMSFGAVSSNQALSDAFRDATDSGAVLVAAAGNEGRDWVDFPAAYSDMIAVTSIEENDIRSAYANYGPQICLLAPGTGIRSTYLNKGYATWSGTSFAVPFVAAEAALILSKNPGLYSSDVYDLMGSTAHSVDEANPGMDGLLGDGLIDISAALSR